MEDKGVFAIEATFRDRKNPRFGLGMTHKLAKTPERRDRLLLAALRHSSPSSVRRASGAA